MSSTFGHGQSTGLVTHTSVSGQRYSEQETVKGRGNQWKMTGTGDGNTYGCLRALPNAGRQMAFAVVAGVQTFR